AAGRGSRSGSPGRADTGGLLPPGWRSLSPGASLKPQLRPARPACPSSVPPNRRVLAALAKWCRTSRLRGARRPPAPCAPSRVPASPRPAIRRQREELARKLSAGCGARRPRRAAPAGSLGAPAPESEPPARAPTASADAELSAQLSRRLDINEGAARPRRCRVFNPYTEFPEFSRRLIKDLESMFKLYDAGRDGFIDLMELKLMMEKLGAPQTHLGLKSMIKEVDEDFDGKLSFREFLLIFHKAAAGELQEDSGLMALAKLSEINVALEGVKGAKNFFEAKVQALSSASKFEAELKAEQDERKREEEERRLRQAAFQELKANFST
uniref:EF-hand domain family member D1 n=4 Tax=Cercopithecidae TaxID=9527 RepID=A0A7N9D7B2_MACFA